jgi:hypothetical protein
MSKLKKTIVAALAVLAFAVVAGPASAGEGAAWDPAPELQPGVTLGS